MDETYPRRVSDQLVVEIKAAMARAGVRSSRALGRLIGESSQYMSTRLDGGNPRTKEQVPLNVRDLAAIAAALDVPASELVARAEAAIASPGSHLRLVSDQDATVLYEAAMDRDPREEQEGHADE